MKRREFIGSYRRRGGNTARGSRTAGRADLAHRRASTISKGQSGKGPYRGVPQGNAAIGLDRWPQSKNRVSLGDKRFAEGGNGIGGIVS